MHIKKLSLIIFMLAAAQAMHAQWQPGINNWIYYNNGNVGIGTSTPQAPLAISNPGMAFALIESTNNNYVSIDLKSNGKVWQWSKRPSGENDAFSLFHHNGTDWVYPQYMTITTAGNVGIGTADPKGYKLAVNGNFICEKVVVKQYPWPDYVFYPGYRLRSLSEVEKYIQQFKHLPDVPSAAEVKKNGLDVGDNQATLLKKIEELTLYLIEQNKEIAKKNTEVAALKDQLQQVLQRLEKLESR